MTPILFKIVLTSFALFLFVQLIKEDRIRDEKPYVQALAACFFLCLSVLFASLLWLIWTS